MPSSYEKRNWEGRFSTGGNLRLRDLLRWIPAYAGMTTFLSLLLNGGQSSAFLAWLAGVGDEAVGQAAGAGVALAGCFVPVGIKRGGVGVASEVGIYFGDDDLLRQWQGLGVDLRSAHHPHCCCWLAHL